jgi:tetratricopeptide (TPR) repeat protein
MIRIMLIIIITWSLLLPIYLGNANVRASVTAQDSEDDEPPIDDEVQNGDDEVQNGDDEVQNGDDEVQNGDDEVQNGDDEAIIVVPEPPPPPLMQPPILEPPTDEEPPSTTNETTTEEPLTTNGSILDGKGAALDSPGEYQDALEYYDRALAIDPDNVSALDGKGAALFYLGREEEAIVNFDRALAIDPDDTNALTNKGTALAGLGRYEEAIGYFDRILTIDPNYIPALVNKGAALGNLGRHQEAMEYFETASLIQESSISTAPASSNKENHFVLITSIWEKEYSSRSRPVQYYSNLDLGNLHLDNLKADKETYGLHFISHGYEIDVNKQTNSGIAKFFIGDYQGAIDIFKEILRVHTLHAKELLVQNPELAASLYNEGLSWEKLGNSTGADYYKNEFSKANDELDPDYKGGYVFKVDFSPPALALISPFRR